MFDRFLSPQKRIAKMVAPLTQGDPSNLNLQSEAAEWVEELPEDDPRRQRVPRKLLTGEYYLFTGLRETSGQVVRVTPHHLEVRLAMWLKLRSGVTIRTSHLYRRIKLDHLVVLPKPRAQKVIQKALELAGEVWRKHHKMCEVTNELIPPKSYPGHPNKGILGPPRERTTISDKAKAAMAEQKAAEAAKAAEEAQAAWEKEQEELRKRNTNR